MSHLPLGAHIFTTDRSLASILDEFTCLVHEDLEEAKSNLNRCTRSSTLLSWREAHTAQRGNVSLDCMVCLDDGLND